MSTVYRKTVWFVRGLREYTLNGYLEAKKKFEDLDTDTYKDLNGKAYMVTGANSGIGKSVSLELAKRGATVHMVCRDKTRGEEAHQELLEASPNKEVHLHLLDMSMPRKVWEFALNFAASGKTLNVLVNNAGCMVNERVVSEDGLEKNFATNTLGTYILTTGLISTLEKSEEPRIITVSSGGMLLVKLDVQDLQFERMNPFDGTMAYAQNKRQQVIITEKWAEMYKSTGIHFSSMHPGWADTPAVKSSMPDFHRRMQGKLRTPEQGADTIVWLCISKEAVKTPSGSFFQDRQAVSKHLPLAWTKSSAGDEETLMTKLKELAEKFRVENTPNE
ncbi:Hypothetical predicted protein [Paramuricea clavata]|uniref:Uncharacterized protein n=1 Tax=Paramuricea clavata TaxID=317549 RepID=A0A7D9LDF0_PARCT|nr:Hypothetical predicted protein [Paramuricea clavata]